MTVQICKWGLHASWPPHHHPVVWSQELNGGKAWEQEYRTESSEELEGRAELPAAGIQS